MRKEVDHAGRDDEDDQWHQPVRLCQRQCRAIDDRAAERTRDDVAPPHWQPARWAVLAIALVHLIGINTWAWHANSQLTQKRTASRDTLLATFPQTTAVVDAGLQMQRGVSSLGQSSGASTAQDMEMMLSALGAAPSMTRLNTVPTAIEFTPGELRFKGLILPPDLGGDLERELQATGFESRMDGDTLVVKVRSAL